jgi:hypothetical protein
MSRYFIARRAKALWVGDDIYAEPSSHLPSVPEHEATDTGLLDMNGAAIMRAPRPISFGREEEW